MGKPFAGRCVKQRLVRRHLPEQLPLAAEGGRRVNRVLRQDGMRHLVQALARRLVVRQFGQGFEPKLAQYGAVYAGEKPPYVDLAIPLVLGLAHELLQPGCKEVYMSFMQLGVSDGKNRQCLRLVGFQRNDPCWDQHNLGQIDTVRASVAVMRGFLLMAGKLNLSATAQ